MGCSSSIQNSTVDAEHLLEIGTQEGLNLWGTPSMLELATDPRWDHDNFQATMNFAKDGEYAVAFIYVGYLRKLAASGQAAPTRHELPQEARHLGAPPISAQLFKVSEPWLCGREFKGNVLHADPRGDHLRALVTVLDHPVWEGGPAEAADDDLVFFDWMSCYQGKAKDESALRLELAKYVWDQVNPLLHTFYRVRLICLPDIPAWVHEVSPNGYSSTPFFDRLFPRQELLLSTFCQRAVNHWHPLLKTAQDPALFAHPRALLKRLTLDAIEKLCKGKSHDEQLRAATGRAYDYEKVCGQVRTLLGHMPRAAVDDVGFRTFCEEANIAWVRFGALETLAARGGPFPRRQDLPEGFFVNGAATAHRPSPFRRQPRLGGRASPIAQWVKGSAACRCAQACRQGRRRRSRLPGLHVHTAKGPQPLLQCILHTQRGRGSEA